MCTIGVIYISVVSILGQRSSYCRSKCIHYIDSPSHFHKIAVKLSSWLLEKILKSSDAKRLFFVVFFFNFTSNLQT